jgi:hypothetical protein
MALSKRNPGASNPPNGRTDEGAGGKSGNHQDNSKITNRPLPTESDGDDLIQKPKKG